MNSEESSLLSMADLRGLWRRKWISSAEDGGVSLSVYWLQTDSLFADIRLPVERRIAASTVAEADAAGLRDLAACEGFAGRAELHEAHCTWHRAFDWQPDVGVADIGHVRAEGDLLYEHGVHRDYSEVWQRLTPARAPAFGLELRDLSDGRAGYLVSIADFFIYARGRPAQLRGAGDLTTMLDDCSDTEAKRALFDAEIAMGEVSPGWLITHCTYPWREGERLFQGPLATVGGTLTMAETDRDGRVKQRCWQVVAHEATPQDGAVATAEPT